MRNIEKDGMTALHPPPSDRDAGMPQPVRGFDRLANGIGIVFMALVGGVTAIYMLAIFVALIVWGFSLPWYGMILVLFLSFFSFFLPGMVALGNTGDAIRCYAGVGALLIYCGSALIGISVVLLFWVLTYWLLSWAFTLPWYKMLFALLLSYISFKAGRRVWEETFKAMIADWRGKPMGELPRLGLGLGLLIMALVGYGAAVSLFLLFVFVALWAVELPWYGMIPVLFLSFLLLLCGGGAAWQLTTESIRDDLRKINPPKPVDPQRPARPSLGEAIGTAFLGLCSISIVGAFWFTAVMSLWAVPTVPWPRGLLGLLLAPGFFWLGWKFLTFTTKVLDIDRNPNTGKSDPNP
jgi:hypothetical protein